MPTTVISLRLLQLTFGVLWILLPPPFHQRTPASRSTASSYTLLTASAAASGIAFVSSTEESSVPTSSSSPSSSSLSSSWLLNFPLSVGFHELRTYILTINNHQHSPYYRYLSTADTYINQGNLYEARKLYQQILGTYTIDMVQPYEKSVYYLMLGYCSAKLYLNDDAEQEFQHAITYSRPLAYLGYTALGMLNIRKGLFREALQNLEIGLIYRENYFPTIHMVGSIAFILGDIERGLRMYTMGLRVLEETMPSNSSRKNGSAPPSKKGTTEQPPYNGKDPLKNEVIHHIFQILNLQYMDNPYPDLHQTELGLKAFIQRIQTIDLAHFHRSMGLELINTGAFEAGQIHLRKTITLHPSDYGSMLLFVTLAVPFVYTSVEEIYTVRAELVRNIREALEDRATVTHPEQLHELYYLTYQLPYMGLPSHLLMKDITRLFASSDAPVLSITSIDLYRTYPYVLSHATGNNRWETFAPYRYQNAPHPPPGAYVRQFIRNYFILNSARSMDNSIPSVTDKEESKSTGKTGGGGSFDPSDRYPSSVSSSISSTTVVKIGILSYQIHDCPVGNLLYHLMIHLRGYAAAYASVVREGNHCVPYSLFSMHNPSSSLCTYLEAPTMGAGTQPRYINPSNYTVYDWTDTTTNPVLLNTEVSMDPMGRYGFVSIPGVVAFNVTLFRLHYGGDNVTRKMNVAADQVVMLPSHPFDLEQARNAISREHVDILIASDPGIQPEIYSLLFSRMAPIQMAYWGVDRAHTLSLGLPDSIDYYVVGDKSSDDQIQEQIQEQVVRLGDIGIFASPPPSLPSDQEKFTIASLYGLLENRHMYLLPVTLNALHPSFDSILVGILRKDTDGEILSFYDDRQSLWLTKVQERLRHHPLMTIDMFKRLRFIKEISPSQKRIKWSLMASVEVILDTYPVSIGYDALEALDVGTPVITLSNLKNTLRSYTIGALQRMNIPELIVRNESEYINTAVRIATDTNFRKLIKQKITGRRASYQWFAKENTDVLSANVNVNGEILPLTKPVVDSVLKGKSKRLTPEIGPVLNPWRDLPRYLGKITDPNVSLTNDEHLQRLQKEGYNDAKLGTLNDWLQFLGTVGRPYAEDREATELEIASSLFITGKTNQKSGGPKGFSRSTKNRKKLINNENLDTAPLENEILPSDG